MEGNYLEGYAAEGLPNTDAATCRATWPAKSRRLSS
jgi:hypothetical protein